MKIVAALGGNALGLTPSEQLRNAEKAASAIAELAEDGFSIIVVHGNGPQVGMINLGMNYSAGSGVIPEEIPLAECGAMSEGYIGYHLQNTISNELNKRGLDIGVATVITQVVVDRYDPAFQDPTKPIGSFYSKEEADRLAAEKGWTMKEDAGRGWRRMVPSPEPCDIVEKDAVRRLSDAGTIVIAAGGGGIPVVRKNGRLEGVAAVIDKDLAAEKVAELSGADRLIILTAVDGAYLGWNTENRKKIDRMTPVEAFQLCEEGCFAKGSMLPKVKAAARFAEYGGVSVIASLDDAVKAASGKAGTIVAEKTFPRE
ncbi:MAG: carbamate kinase [Oscillospiraceae bacterium]|jgi:carbamate kinase